MIPYRFRRPGQHPDLVPQLARGKHRSPRTGACFMEFASYLAGERWSDHPTCTHPLLAALARLVNDHVSEEGRQRLVGLIPAVVGLTGDDPRIDVHLALRAATAGLPVVAESRQRTLAVCVLAAEGVLDELDARPAGTLTDTSRRALAQVPHAAAWAQRFAPEGGARPTLKRFRRHAAPVAVRQGVVGLAEACVPDADERLYDLLAGAIDDCEALLGVDRHRPTTPADPAEAVTHGGAGAQPAAPANAVLDA